MNKTIEKYFQFYDDNSLQLTDIKKDKKYIRHKDDYNEVFDRIAETLKTNTNSKESRELMDKLETAVYGLQLVEMKYAFYYAFLSGIKMGMSVSSLDEKTEKLIDIQNEREDETYF